MDAELFPLLPSQQTQLLAAAIGRRLVEVERLFWVDLPTFLENSHFPAIEYFAYNSGPVQLHFAEDLIHVLDVWGEQLSIVVLTEPLHGDADTTLYQLSKTGTATPALKACLGKTCQDVRIWRLKEEIVSEEAKQVAISYVFADSLELFYCIYLHDDLDSDYLLLTENVPRDSAKRFSPSGDRVESCFSIAQGEYL